MLPPFEQFSDEYKVSRKRRNFAVFFFTVPYLLAIGSSIFIRSAIALELALLRQVNTQWVLLSVISHSVSFSLVTPCDIF
jgi:hypothetical protein